MRRPLRERLEALHARWHRPEFLHTDPVQFPRRCEARDDREVVALLAAAFAWGNVAAIHKSVAATLDRLGPHPAETLRGATRAELTERFEGLYHRRIHAPDLVWLGTMLGEAYRRHGSLESLWRSVDAGRGAAIDTIPAFLKALQSLGGPPPLDRGVTQGGAPLRAGVGLAPFGLGASQPGAPFKRVCMWLRWVARPDDGIDLGLWKSLDPARLTMPLDVHVLRFARSWRLVRHRTASGAAARALTARLAKECPEDPCRYDFAIVRAGMAANGRLGSED